MDKPQFVRPNTASRMAAALLALLPSAPRAWLAGLLADWPSGLEGVLARAGLDVELGFPLLSWRSLTALWVLGSIGPYWSVSVVPLLLNATAGILAVAVLNTEAVAREVFKTTVEKYLVLGIDLGYPDIVSRDDCSSLKPPSTSLVALYAGAAIVGGLLVVAVTSLGCSLGRAAQSSFLSKLAHASTLYFIFVGDPFTFPVFAQPEHHLLNLGFQLSQKAELWAPRVTAWANLAPSLLLAEIVSLSQDFQSTLAASFVRVKAHDVGMEDTLLWVSAHSPCAAAVSDVAFAVKTAALLLLVLSFAWSYGQAAKSAA